jgi:ubiquitin-conjugating enzyme E2 variant
VTRHLEIAAIVSSLVILAALATHVARHASAICLLALPLGVATADLVSGLFHFLADRFGDRSTPFVRSFREHHQDPRAITRHDFIETNGDVAIFVAVGLPILLACTSSTFARAWLLALGGASLCTSQIHKWAHARRVPRWVRALQAAGVILSPRRHARHHAGAHDHAYCITTGWLNPVCDALHAFPLLERLIRAFLPVRR